MRSLFPNATTNQLVLLAALGATGTLAMIDLLVRFEAGTETGLLRMAIAIGLFLTAAWYHVRLENLADDIRPVLPAGHPDLDTGFYDWSAQGL